MSNTRSVGSPSGKVGDSVDALIAEFEVFDAVSVMTARNDGDADRLIREFEVVGSPDSHVLEPDETFMIELPFSPAPATSAASAAAVVTPPQSRVLRIVWDADGCAYNRTYRQALFFFMYDYMDRIRSIKASIEANEDPSLVKQRSRALYDELHEKFQGEYRFKSESEFNEVYSALNMKARELLIVKLKELGLSGWCEKVVREKPPYSVEWETVALRVNEMKSDEADTYFNYLSNGQSINWLMQQYLAEINTFGENFYQYIFVASNLALAESFLLEREMYDEVVLMVGSNRQSYSDDQNCKWVNSTGSIFKDLNDYLKVLEEIFTGKSVRMDRVTMADIQNRLPPGESMNRALSDSREHAPYLWDEKKLTMLYVYTHRAAIEHKGSKIVVQFIDDREDIISSLYALFHSHPELLPAGLVLSLIRYDGRINYRVYIEGTGEIDHDYTNSSKIMSALSEPTSPDGSRVIIDSVNSLLNENKARQFFECRESEKKKVMATSLVVGGSSSFFAQRESHVVNPLSQSYTLGITNK